MDSKLKVLKEMVEAKEDYAQGWYLLGLEYLDRGDFSEAFAAFSKAVKEEEARQLVFSSLLEFLNRHESNDHHASEEGHDDGTPHVQEPANHDTHWDELEDQPDDDKQSRSLKVIDGTVNQVADFHSKRLAESRINFNDVGGLDALKETIQLKIIKPFKEPGLFSKFKKKAGGGILLYGPPGCGKTFVAKATAGECRANFMNVRITDILNPYIGVSESNLDDIFTTARASKPSVLFFDEVDAIGYNRSKSVSEHSRPLVDQFLSEMEGVDTDTDRLLVIGATNMPWDVDSALKRPGRFDRMIFVPPPDKLARMKIFELKLVGKPVDSSIHYEWLAEQTEMYSGADIENVVEMATENVLTEIMKSGKERAITNDDLIASIKATSPSTIEWLRTIKNYVKYANQTGWYNDVNEYLKRVKKLI